MRPYRPETRCRPQPTMSIRRNSPVPRALPPLLTIAFGNWKCSFAVPRARLNRWAASTYKNEDDTQSSAKSTAANAASFADARREA